MEKNRHNRKGKTREDLYYERSMSHWLSKVDLAHSQGHPMVVGHLISHRLLMTQILLHTFYDKEGKKKAVPSSSKKAASYFCRTLFDV